MFYAAVNQLHRVVTWRCNDGTGAGAGFPVNDICLSILTSPGGFVSRNTLGSLAIAVRQTTLNTELETKNADPQVTSTLMFSGLLVAVMVTFSHKELKGCTNGKILWLDIVCSSLSIAYYRFLILPHFLGMLQIHVSGFARMGRLAQELARSCTTLLL